MLKRELVLHAKYLGLKGVSKLNKAELEDVILEYVGLSRQEHMLIIGEEDVDIDLGILVL